MRHDIVYVTLGKFLDHWDGVRMITLKLLDCYEDIDIGYRLVSEWRSVGDLFHHIGGHQYYVGRGVIKRRWDPLPGEPDIDWEKHRMEKARSIDALSEWLTFVQDQVRTWFVESDNSVLEDLRDDNPWHEGIRGWLLLHHAYQDELHHRGQLYAIARKLGRTPPAVYAEEHSEYWNSRKRK
ncbi:MAG: DinB family protein [Candidatus Thorarchaeota archaeon]